MRQKVAAKLLSIVGGSYVSGAEWAIGFGFEDNSWDTIAWQGILDREIIVSNNANSGKNKVQTPVCRGVGPVYAYVSVDPWADIGISLGPHGRWWRRPPPVIVMYLGKKKDIKRH